MQKFRKKGGDYLVMALAAVISSVGVYFFKFPNHFTTGGVSGLAIVTRAFLPGMSQTLLTNIFNIGLMLLGMLTMGKAFALRAGVYSLMFSGMIALLELLFPLSAPLTNQPFMELILAVLLPSISTALLFNIGSSGGGTDVIAMMLKKFAGVYNTGTALLLADLAIGLASFFVFDVQTGIFSVFGLAMRSVLTDIALTSLNQRKYFHIITADPDPIQTFITDTLGRSATLFEGVGAYTGDDRTLILTVVSPRQAVELRNHVKSLSPKNFLLITNTSEIIGRGFRSPV